MLPLRLFLQLAELQDTAHPRRTRSINPQFIFFCCCLAMASWQKATETVKKLIITKQWHQPWNRLYTTKAWSEFKLECVLHSECGLDCHSRWCQGGPLVCTCACLAVSQAHSLWLTETLVFAGMSSAKFFWRLLGGVKMCCVSWRIFYFHPKKVCWLLSAY